MADRIDTPRRRILAFAAIGLALVLGLFLALRGTSVAPVQPALEQPPAADASTQPAAPATKVAPLSETKPHTSAEETADVVPPKPEEEAPAAGEAAKAAPKKLPNSKNPGELPRIGPHLTDLYNEYKATIKAGVPWQYDGTLLMVRENRVVIEAVGSHGAEALKADLANLNAQKIVHYKHLVNAELPIAELERFSALESLSFARPAYRPVLRTGSVTSQGDAAMNADDARTTHGVDGTGIKVGVLSDSVHRVIGGTLTGTTLTGSDSQTTTPPDLPATVEVLSEYTGTGATDEGAAMLELVYDVAPGAALSFHTAFNGQADFAQGIEDLRTAGCDIVVDDVFYYAEPFFQDGVIAQAVDTIVADGAAHFSSAGNSGRDSYESDFRDSGITGNGGTTDTLHDFDPTATVDGFQQITFRNNQTITLVLQWDEDFASVSGATGSTSDVDIYILKNTAITNGNTIAKGVANNINADPVEVVRFSANGGPGSTTTAYIAIHVFDGPVPNVIKYAFFGDITVNEHATNSGTCLGHSNAAGVSAVGASAFVLTPLPPFNINPPQLNYYSSAGTTPIYFDIAGNRLASPEIRQNPDITGPDGGNTTFFYNDSSLDADSIPNFFGTSASAPHVGGLAALMLQKAGGANSLNPGEIYSVLEANAIDMTQRDSDFTGTNSSSFTGGEDGAGEGYDDDSGWGFVDALVTLNALDHDSPTDGAITWNVDSNGLWSNETKWSLGFVPNQAGANHHDVTINRTDPASPIVTLDMDATIDDLDLSDKLKLKDGRTLTLTGAYAQNSSAQLQYVVNGTSALTAGLLSVTGDIALAGSAFVDVSGVTLPVSSIGTQFKVPLISYAGSRNSSVFSGLGWSGNTAGHPLSLEYDDTGKKVNLVITYDPGTTPVTIDSFHALAIDSKDASGVLLTWRCASENENLGFRVWRRLAGTGDDWTLLDKDLVPGRLSSAHPSQYRWFDEGGSDCYEYRLEAVDVRGHGEFFARAAQAGRFEVLDAPTPEAATAQAAARAREASRERARDLAAAFDAQSAGARNRSASARVAPPFGGGWSKPGRSGNAPTLADEEPGDGNTAPKSPFKALKAVYADAGVLRIPGGPFADGFDPAKVDVLRGGKPLPVLGVDDGDVVVFGPGYCNRYTTRDALFLVRNANPLHAGAPAAASGLFDAGAAETTVTDTAELGFHDVYFDWGLRPLDYPPWFSSQYLTNDSTRTFALATPGALDAAATLTVRIWNFGRPAGTPPHGTLRAFVNGTPCGEATWNGDANALELTFAVPSNVLVGGANTIDLQTPDLGVPSYLSLLHSMSIEYRRALDAAAAADFQASGNTLYEVSGLPSAELWVVDATDAYGAKLLAYEAKSDDGLFVARFRAGSNTSRVLVVPLGAENGIESLKLRRVARAPKCGYLAVGGVAYEDALEPLLKARRKEGLRPKFTETEELFDAYNFGRYGPAAIRNAVRDRKPDFLLLVGRSHWDYQDLEGLGLDPMVPTFLEATGEFAEAPCDALLGDGHAAVGRFPVLTPDELSIAIERTLSYKAGASGGAALMAADRLDPNAGDFAAEAEAIASSVPEYVWQRAYLGITHATADDVGDAMRDAANGEAELIVYIGHGSSSKLSKETIMTVADAASWTGNLVFVQSTCTPNYFIHNVPGYYSIAEALLTQPQGGIAASLGTTTYLASPPAAEFMKELLNASRAPGVRWGEALRAAQQAMEVRAETAAPGDAQAFRDLAKTESLLGDPALPAAAAAKK